MIYDKVKVTNWGNIETGDKFYGVAVRDGRKWQHCLENYTPMLFLTSSAADEYAAKLTVSLKERGLWKTKDA